MGSVTKPTSTAVLTSMAGAIVALRLASLVQYARPSAEALAQHQAERNPARRRK